jgi:alkylmercury lyase-like protein
VLNTTEYLDMSVVNDRAVAAALPQLLTEWRMKKRWNTLSDETRSLHRDILQSYLQTGAPPNIEGLNADMIQDLCARDLIVMNDASIASAYPFSTAPTLHSVEINGVQVASVCAIDALGTGAMVGAASKVTSHCATCGMGISVEIANDGLTVLHSIPNAPRVWAGIVAISGCAATTQCQSMLMFCNQGHLDEWLNRAKDKPDGFNFSILHAVQAGAAIFRPFLAKTTG